MTGYWIAAAALLALTGSAEEQKLPGWMAGAWCTEGPATDRTCEYWTPDSGGLMIGASITTKSGKAASFEQARIAPVDGAPVYFASPEGGPAVQFRAVESGPASITFAKPDHDYPQRVRYWMEGEVLMAEIALADGSKPMQWTFRRLAKQ